MNGAAKAPGPDMQTSYRLTRVAVNVADPSTVYVDALVVARDLGNWAMSVAHARPVAQARALENQCYVAVAPTVGLAPWSAALDENHGQAALFGPPDRGFPADGVVAAGPMDQPGWLFAELHPALIDHVRAEGAVRNHRDFPRAPMPRPAVAAFR
jgi:predicted amidohydrolase